MANESVDFNQPVVVPVVKALTAAPTILGVPYMYFMLCGIVSAIVFLIVKNPLYLAVFLPLYAIGRVLLTWDKNIFEIIGVRLLKCAPRTNGLWGARSYRL